MPTKTGLRFFLFAFIIVLISISLNAVKAAMDGEISKMVGLILLALSAVFVAFIIYRGDIR